ncbi:MAG TPA: CdaR family protein [Candidatus Xenobia bacterium]|nr:CdaR family protein [Candidatus Xenobia bacterium]
MRATTMSNLGFKLLSLLLAGVVWFNVSAPRREPPSERTFAAAVSLVGLPRELVITTPVPETVNVRLRARGADFRAVLSQRLEVTLDLGWVQPGEAEITLRPQAINVSPPIEVVSIDPDKLRFRVEQLRQKSVPIRPFLVGSPPDGFLVGEATVDPERALISGPNSYVQKASEAATERIIMTGRTATFTQTVAVVADTPYIRVLEPPTVQVTVPVLAVVGPQLPETAAPARAGTKREKR